MSEPILSLTEAVAALGMGLLGSPHCIGMCGGIATAMTPARGYGAQSVSGGPLWLAAGRIGTYAALGALGGAAGALLARGGEGLVAPLLRPALGLLLIAVGLSVSGWWPRSLAWLEAGGAVIWRRVAPAARRLTPVITRPRALAAGALWGLLPCGLVYGALAAATVSGSAVKGAAFMALFGLGTAPAVAAAGWMAEWLRGRLGRTGVRQGAGALMMLAGVWTAAIPAWTWIAPGGHHAHGASAPAAHHEHPVESLLTTP